MMDPWLVYVACTTTMTIILDVILIRYYRRFWLTIKSMGLDAATSAGKRTADLMTGGQAWKKLK